MTKKTLALLLVTAAAFCMTSRGLADCVEAGGEFRPALIDGGDQWGNAVAMDDDVLIIGGMAYDFGTAHVFRFDGAAWIEEQLLVPAEQYGQTYCGNAVTISGNVAVVGCASDDTIYGVEAGSAGVFRFDGNSWTQEAMIQAGDGGLDLEFGHSVAVSGDRIVVGAWYDDEIGYRAGAAYVFRYVDGLWLQEQKLTADDGVSSDWFGSSVAIGDERILIGAMLNGGNGYQSGAAYSFVYEDAAWVQDQKLLASDGAPGVGFGNALGMSGDVASVGAFFDSELGTSAGAVYVFRWNGSSWAEEQKLTASDAAASDEFGFSVAVEGSSIITGAYGNDDFGFSSGSAYLFGFDGTNWTERQKLLPGDPGAGELFGWAVGVTTDQAVVTAWNNVDQMSGVGSAYPFALHRPIINIQPVDQAVTLGAVAGFEVSASGTGSLVYQWYHDDDVLADGGRIAGATSAILTISPTEETDAGSYWILVTDDCGQTASLSATLTLLSGCAADANGDGLIDPLDGGYVLARLGCPVNSGDPDCDAADANDDDQVDPLDYGFVLARFGECE